MGLSIYMVDPASLTPAYDIALCDALARREVTVQLFASHFRHEPKIFSDVTFPVRYSFFDSDASFFPFVRKVRRAALYPLRQRALLQTILKARPEIVHIQWSLIPPSDLWFVRSLRKAGIPVVHTIHDIKPLFPVPGGIKIAETLYAQMDALIVHAESAKLQLLKRYPKLTPSKVWVIPHGPLLADAVPSHASAESARKALGIDSRAKVLLFFGGIRPYKGTQRLIDAFAEMVPHDPSLFLLIAGSCLDANDTPDFSRLTKFSNKFRADLSFIPTPDAWKYLLSADLVVLPYEAVSQSGVLFSAMANARPVVVTNVGDLPELVNASGCGWVVPADADTSLLANTLQTALAQPDILKSRGEKGQQYVNAELSWDKIATKTLALYDSVTRAIRASDNNAPN